MATIELAQLSDHLDADELTALMAALENEADEDIDLESEEDSHIVDNQIDDDIFEDFRDRLGANDLRADIYVPVEFEETFEIANREVGSTYALQLVLDSLREDFFIEDAENEDDAEIDEESEDFETAIGEEDESGGLLRPNEDSGIEAKDAQLRHVWRLLYRAARGSLDTRLCLFLLD